MIYTSPRAFEYAVLTPGASAGVGTVGSTLYFSPGSFGGYVSLGPAGDVVLRWLKSEPPRSTVGAGDSGKPPRTDPGMASLSGSVRKSGPNDWDGFQVVAVDGRQGGRGSTNGRFETPIQLSPGEHSALVYFYTSRDRAVDGKPDAFLRVTARLEAGRWYRVVGSIDNGLVTAWTEDAQNGNRVSEQAAATIYWLTPFVDPDPPVR